MPDPATFPSEDLAAAAQRVIPQFGSSLCRYPDQRGLPSLRQIAIERFDHNHGIRPAIEDVVLTNGSMQGLMLAAQAFGVGKGPVLVEEFTYAGTIRVFRQNNLEIIPIPLDDQGMRMDALEAELDRLATLGSKPAFIYTIASHQNPSGTTLPVERRLRMIELARMHKTLIVEDDCYADVQFTRQAVPALYKLADPGEVVYIGSFSKILGPGVRLGYFAAPEALTSAMLQWKIDGGTSSLSAMVVAEYFNEHLWTHIDEANVVIKRKLDVLLESLEREFAGLDVTWTKPDGGLFVWLRLPAECNRQRIAELDKERGIIYATGQAFHSLGQDVPFLRLAYGFIAEADIPEGVHLMAECVRMSLPAGVSRR
jgi:2-aminoadipate transaminase